MQKYEQEIAELLERLEADERSAPRRVRRDLPPQLPRRRNPVLGRVRRLLAGRRVTSGRLMLGGLSLVVISLLVPNGPVQQALAILGALLFISPVISSLVGRRPAAPSEKMWRGRRLDDDDPSWSEVRSRMESSARDFRRRFRRRY